MGNIKDAYDILTDGSPRLTMKEIFEHYVGQKIGLNFKEIGKFHALTLIAVHDDYFSVRVTDGGAVAHYPFGRCYRSLSLRRAFR
jgi:hypothetical protein